jgi:hypothetical protein
MTEAAQAPFKGPFLDEVTAAKIAHEYIDQNAIGLSGPASIDLIKGPMCILWRAGKPVAVAAIIRDDMNYSYAVLARATAPAGHVLTGEITGEATGLVDGGLIWKFGDRALDANGDIGTIRQVESHGVYFMPDGGTIGAWRKHDALVVAEPTPAMSERDRMGQIVRQAWVRWALHQPKAKPSWLVPYHKLTEPDKEADRQIAEAVEAAILAAHPSPTYTEGRRAGLLEAAKVCEARCADVLSKQDGRDDAVDLNLRMFAALLPEVAAAIRALAEGDGA